MRTREELAWAAGLFEGEGCFTRNHGVPVANLASTDLDVLERFAEVMGFGRIYVMGHTRDHPVWKPARQWTTTSFEHAQQTVAMLWPWLGTRRRARAHELLAGYWQQRLVRARGDGSLAGELFGKRHADLTLDELREHNRVKAERSRRAHGVPLRHWRT